MTVVRIIALVCMVATPAAGQSTYPAASRGNVVDDNLAHRRNLRGFPTNQSVTCTSAGDTRN